MSVRTSNEVRSSLVERMRESGVDKQTAQREAEQSVRRVWEQGEKNGTGSSDARK